MIRLIHHNISIIVYTCITPERHIHHFIYNKMTAWKGDLHALFTIPWGITIKLQYMNNGHQIMHVCTISAMGSSLCRAVEYSCIWWI